MKDKIYFITGNPNKYLEIKKIIPNLEMKTLELDEIQSDDSKQIIKHKLNEASKYFPNKNILVEDTRIHLDCLNGFPGPFIKWFLKKNSLEKIYEMSYKLENRNIQVKTIIGYRNSNQEDYFFQVEVKGIIVESRGRNNFGFDPIFLPEGYIQTFGEMSKEEKNKISHRGLTIKSLKEFLNKVK